MILIVCRLKVVNRGSSNVMIEDKRPTETRLLFAQNLRRVREQLGMSQEMLAELAGLHRTYVSSVERGERNVSIDNIERLAKALNAEPAHLLERHD
jgi:predicted transcriptional regulator